MRINEYEITDRLIEKFNDKWMEVDNGCWLWTACISPNGYGMMCTARRANSMFWMNDYATRISYQIHIGEISDHHKITSTCGNKWCVNPDHLVSTPR